MKPNEGHCHHKASFLKWFWAVEYYGYYECDSCHEIVNITKEERRKYHIKYILCVPIILLFTIVSIELSKPYLLLLGWFLHAVIYFLYLYLVSPANSKNNSKDE